jgi:hypothetical protein
MRICPLNLAVKGNRFTIELIEGNLEAEVTAMCWLTRKAKS